MPIYDFKTVLVPQPNAPDIYTSVAEARYQDTPIIHQYPAAISQLSDVGGRQNIFGNNLTDDLSHIQEFLTPGFRELDSAMKAFWSGIRVPTKDAYRFMRVKIAGGDRSLLIWKDDLTNGRVKLPIASLDRGSSEYLTEKYSPPRLAMGRRYLTNRGDRVAKVYRPVPYLVNYTMIVWATHKRDAEYILYQVLTKFNPLAEFVMFDGHLSGVVTIKFGGHTDATEKEVAADQQAKIKYEYKMSAEAWLPLPEKIVPTVLGRVGVIKEGNTGATLFGQRGSL